MRSIQHPRVSTISYQKILLSTSLHFTQHELVACCLSEYEYEYEYSYSYSYSYLYELPLRYEYSTYLVPTSTSTRTYLADYYFYV